MSSAGRELHGAGPGPAPPTQRPASAAPCAAPGAPGGRPALALPPEAHGWTLGAREPPWRPPSPGEAPRPQRQQPEMRGGGGGSETRPGRCQEGPREGARPGLPTCGENGRPSAEEFQPVQEGREHVSSPSCLEMKDLLQDLEENPSQGQAASGKRSRLPNEAPGMKAEGTGLCCDPRAQARTGALLEASRCSGGVAVSGNGSFVSQEPLSPASSEEGELPAGARHAVEEPFQSPGPESPGRDAVCTHRPSVQQETFGTPSLALALDTCPTGRQLETTSRALQGSSPWGDGMALSAGARDVQEGSLSSSPRGGRMEDLGAAPELPTAKALLQAGSPAGGLPHHEHRGGDSLDLSSRPVRRGRTGLQKGSAGHSCWEGGGERFPSEHSRFLNPAQQLTAPKGRGWHPERRASPAEAGSAQGDGSSFLCPKEFMGKRNGALLLKKNNFSFLLQNNCSIKCVSAFLSCLAPQLDFGGTGLPLRAEPADSVRTALLLCDLVLPQCATSSFRVMEIRVSTGDRSLKVPPFRGSPPVAQKAVAGSGHAGPVDSLSPEGVIVMRSSGAWAHHKEAFTPSQASGRLQAVMNEGAWEMVRWVLRGAENGVGAVEPFWRKALCLSDRAVNTLSSAPEQSYAPVRNLFLDCKNLQKGRRGTATKIAFILGISPALSESRGRFVSLQKMSSCSPFRNNCMDLGRVGSPLGSPYPLQVPCSNPSNAAAEYWSVDGAEALDGSESILERKSNIFPPYERVEVHNASFGADAGGMRTIGSATVCNNNRLFLQLAFDGDLSKTSLLCRAPFRKGQCLEEQEKYQIRCSSPACHLSYLSKKDSFLCTRHSAQQREEPIYQMKIFLYPCYFLDSCTLFEQKNDSPKTEFLECQQPSLILYKKLNYHDLQTVISLAIKYVQCNKNESLHSKMELKATPPATALLTDYHQGPFREIIIESSNNNAGSEFTGNRLNEDCFESQSPRTLSGCSESTTELQNRKNEITDFVKNWAPHGLPSTPESVHKRPSEKFNFKNGLLSASRLASSPFQTSPTTSATMKGQKRMKGLLLDSYRKRKIPSLVSAGLGLSQFPQNKKLCLFPKEAGVTSPLEAHSSPLAQQHCRVTLLWERKADGHSRPFTWEGHRAGSLTRRSVAAAGPRTHFKGPRAAAVVSLRPLEQPWEAKQDSEAGQREASHTAGMPEGCLAHILCGPGGSSEAPLENTVLPLRGGKVTFSFKAAIHAGLPLGLAGEVLGSDSGKAKDSPQPSVTWWHRESLSWDLRAELFSSSRSPAETLSSSGSTSSGLKGGRLASFPTWPRMKGGLSPRVERRQQLAGGPKRGLEGHSVDECIRRGDPKAGAQPSPPKEKPQVRRRLVLGQPPGSFSAENAGGAGDLAWGTLASLGRAGRKRRRQGPPFHTQSETKRQKRGLSCAELPSLNPHCQDRSQQTSRWPSCMGALGSFPPAVGCDQSRSTRVLGDLRLQRPFPASRKLSRTTRMKVGMPHWLRAPKPPVSKTVPGEKAKLVYSAQSATEPAAPRAILWDPLAKQQGHRSSSLTASWLTGQPKDAALLTRLSWLAEKWLAPACQPFPPRRALLPSAARWGQLTRRRLLEIFSFVSFKLSSPPWLSSCCCKVVGSRALAVYSVESIVLCFFELGSDTPSVFPVSFHHQMDVGPTRKLPKAGFPSLVSRFALGSPPPRPPSVWSLSFHLPRSYPVIMPVQKDSEPGSALAPKEGEAIACSTSCPTAGLPTALALFSPGCYRAWTRRRRHPSGRIPVGVQRLSLLPLALVLKGSQGCTSVSVELFSSFPSLLGSVLSIWSQHGPSTHLSNSAPLHSGPSKGQPAAHPATAGLSHRTSQSLPALVPSLLSDTSRAVKNNVRLESILSVLLPTSCQAPEPAHPPLGFPALGSGDGRGASVPASPKNGAQLGKDESKNKPKRVSQIRIRKTIPKPDPNLTPMGLPRPKRLKKTEFSLEEIYTNQNYKSPPATRCLETIFEEPKEKNGSLISISQQKRKRILEFQDFTIPRKRRARSRVRVTGGYTRAQKAAIEGRELDVLLVQKLTDLETFFAKEESQGQMASCS